MNDTVNNEVAARRHHRAAPVGLLFIILCVIGAFTIVRFCYNVTKNIVDNSSQKTAFESELMPLVMFDPIPFEDPSTFGEINLLQSSIWAALLDSDRDYEYDDNNQLIVPASDVDVACNKLFGPSVTLVHQSFGDYEINYYYDESIKSYKIPSTATMSGFYTPRIDDMTKSGDVITLKVGYIPPTSVLDLNGSGDNSKDEPYKYMIYEMHKGSSGYYVYAIRNEDGTVDTDYGLVGGESSMPEDEYTDAMATEPESGVITDPDSSAAEGGASGDSSGESSETSLNENGEPLVDPSDYPTVEG